MKSISGVPLAYFETGTEGVIWSVQEDGKPGYDGLHCIAEGDHLKLWNPATGREVFDEKIKYDWKIGYKNYPKNPQYGQQVSLGWWVHGIQEGFDPDDWGRLFFREVGEIVFRAELIKKISRKTTRRTT